MARIQASLALAGIAALVAACSGSAATGVPSGGLGGSPSPSPSTAVVIVGPASPAPSSVASPSADASSAAPSGSSPQACEVIDQAAASSGVGIIFPAGKPVSPKLIVPLAYRSQCIYTNGASPATNLTVDLSTYDPTYPVPTARDQVIEQLLAKVGTNNGLTFSASKVMIDGNPGVTSLFSGTGAGGVAVHIETAEYWKGTLTVTMTVGNGPAGAAVALATTAAGKL